MPPSGAIGVGIGASVAVDFTEVLNANTVTTSSFTLTGPTGLLPGTIVVKDFSAEFKPDQLLIEFATEYSWTLTTDLRDTAGHSFAANYTATFTTVLADGLYYYRITNQQIGDTLSLEIPSSGTSCIMASTAESASQWWRLIETATPGEYVMVSRATGAPRAGQPGSPRAFFFDTCERTIEEISAWKFKDFRGQGMGLREEPVDVDDHLCDCFRYIATSFPEASVREKPKKPPTIGDWKIARQKRIGRELRRAATAPEENFDEDYI